MTSLALLYLLGFTLHNLEEALWLPRWSCSAGRFHQPVDEDTFRFTVIIITALGYLCALPLLLTNGTNELGRHLFYGFVVMMTFNAVVPHLAATVVLKKYAPGTLTAFLLNVPIGLLILLKSHSEPRQWLITGVFTVIVGVLFLLMIKLLFALVPKIVPKNSDQ